MEGQLIKPSSGLSMVCTGEVGKCLTTVLERIKMTRLAGVFFQCSFLF